MQAQLKDVFDQLGAAAGDDAAADLQDASFQSTIDETVKRLQESGRQATASASQATTAAADDDLFAEMLRQLQQQQHEGTDGLPIGDDGDENLSKMLLGMMEELTSKEILYEPMKELDDRFPRWLDLNRGSVTAPDLRRYEEQRGLVREMVVRFEAPDYSDEKAADREFILDRMQKVREIRRPRSPFCFVTSQLFPLFFFSLSFVLGCTELMARLCTV